LSLIFFVFGTMIGSFLNALIYRLPRDIDIVFPRSFCTSCHFKIFWYQNIPLISFLMLRGKCAKCSQKIPWRYPFVEFICGLASIYLMPENVNEATIIVFLFYLAIFSIFLMHVFIDFEHFILPDSLNLILAIMFLAYSIVHKNFTFWLFGGLLGLGIPFLVTWLFYKFRGQIGLGGGDIKLYAALGLYLGPLGVVHNIFLSCLIGTIPSLFLIITKKMNKNDPIPFGPFIVIVASFQIFFPELFGRIIAIIN